MKKNYKQWVLVLIGIAFLPAFSHAKEGSDTNFMVSHVYERYTTIIKKVDDAVRENKAVAYLDDKYTKQISSIEMIGETEVQFRVNLPVAYNPTGASMVSDSTFIIGLLELNYTTSIANYQVQMTKEGAPHFNLEGYGFGKVKNMNSDYASLYYLKLAALEQILTENELNFYLNIMEGSFVRKETKKLDKSTSWSITTNPIGQIDIIRRAMSIDTAMQSAFDSFFANNLVPTTFATKDNKGNIQYQLTEKSKADMEKDSKIKEEDIFRVNVVLTENDIFDKVLLGWKLENEYRFGKNGRSRMIVIMKEAVFFDKSMFLKYSPTAKNWVDLIF